MKKKTKKSVWVTGVALDPTDHRIKLDIQDHIEDGHYGVLVDMSIDGHEQQVYFEKAEAASVAKFFAKIARSLS